MKGELMWRVKLVLLMKGFLMKSLGAREFWEKRAEMLRMERKLLLIKKIEKMIEEEVLVEGQ